MRLKNSVHSVLPKKSLFVATLLSANPIHAQTNVNVVDFLEAVARTCGGSAIETISTRGHNTSLKTAEITVDPGTGSLTVRKDGVLIAEAGGETSKAYYDCVRDLARSLGGIFRDGDLSSKNKDIVPGLVEALSSGVSRNWIENEFGVAQYQNVEKSCAGVPYTRVSYHNEELLVNVLYDRDNTVVGYDLETAKSSLQPPSYEPPPLAQFKDSYSGFGFSDFPGVTMSQADVYYGQNDVPCRPEVGFGNSSGGFGLICSTIGLTGAAESPLHTNVPRYISFYYYLEFQFHDSQSFPEDLWDIDWHHLTFDGIDEEGRYNEEEERLGRVAKEKFFSVVGNHVANTISVGNVWDDCD